MRKEGRKSLTNIDRQEEREKVEGPDYQAQWCHRIEDENRTD